MKIEHIALWTQNLESLKTFYETYFQATASAKYHNQKTHFQSYFLTFPTGGARLEIMYKPTVVPSGRENDAIVSGLAHCAFSVGSRDAVEALTSQLEHDGFTIASYPRTTGDGYYESCVLDPDGNLVEITI